MKYTPVQVLRKVQTLIRQEPKRINMNRGIVILNPRHDIHIEHEIPPCCTVGCIAGWSVLAANDTETPNFKEITKKLFPSSTFYSDNKQVEWGYIAEKTIEILDIPLIMSKHLFFVTHWVGPWARKYLAAPNKIEQAKVVIDYIDFFIDSFWKDGKWNFSTIPLD